MSIPLRLLLVEDSDDDAVLLLRLLRSAGFVPDYRRVESESEMRDALGDTRWNLVIADNSLPEFDATRALALFKEAGLDVPFIIVSGHIDDASAVAAMKAGAHDYLLKDNLARLIPAIKRELEEAENRRSKRQVEEALRFQSKHDTLTGLLNRREFERVIAEALTALSDAGTHVLCFIDLDQFKIVNDTCGHIAGDEMLRALSSLLTQQMRAGDTLARLGGDEFGLLLRDCSVPDALRLLTQLQQVIGSFKLQRDGFTFHATCSIGVVEVTADHTYAELMSSADVACYAAKELGRNRIHVYRGNDEEMVRRRREMRWVSRISSALDEDCLILFHQPIFEIGDGAPREVFQEALLRMVEDDGALTMPGAFIPAAERFKLMSAVDNWVVHHLFAAIAKGAIPMDLSDPHALLFINLSGVTISDGGFGAYVEEQLAEFNIPPSRICFEITESAAIANLSAALPLLHRLRDLGCRFALDDFGSGLSSFGYLKQLPVDFVKIDGSFVCDIAKDPIARAMVEAINKISHVMGLQTIAEFVESPEVLDVLREIGVEYAQGYLLGVPRPWPLRASQHSPLTALS